MKKSKLKGRPLKDKSEKKAKKVTVKLSEQEHIDLIKKVGLAQSTISAFVREAIYTGQIKERISVENLSLIRKLAGMANNLNQLAKEAHFSDFRYIAEECTRISMQIDKVLNDIRQ